ncbi:MAG: hypothetical protein K2Y10_00100 [Burkholderiaceae bacterium]|nr:hypothetical protein [Burkholderiaceae bacterium]
MTSLGTESSLSLYPHDHYTKRRAEIREALQPYVAPEVLEEDEAESGLTCAASAQRNTSFI